MSARTLDNPKPQNAHLAHDTFAAPPVASILPKRARDLGIARWLCRWAPSALIVLAAWWAVQAWQTRHLADHLPVDLPLTWIDAQGGVHTQSLAQWMQAARSPVLALHLWAQWCPICRTEESAISDLLADAAPLLTVAQASGEVAAVRGHLQRRGLNWPVVVDPQGTLAHRLGLSAVPAWVVIDRQGRVWAPSVGYTPGWALRARLQWARWRAAWGGP